VAEVLGGGRHFATDVGRILGGAALTPEAGAELLERELIPSGGGARMTRARAASRGPEALA
jgi:hypothetical protein